MNDTLKAAGRIGAELGAAKAENEAMRILLRESYSELLVMKTEVGFRGKTLELIDRIDAFLSQQPEPTDTYTAVDMATAAAQGFRDGQAAVEQAPAEDEHQPVGWHTDDHLTDKSATTYDREVADRWRGKGWPVYELYARPAQTEQQPAYVECRECTDCGHVGINDAHQTDATCAMCDWSGPSPVEDQCPDCGKENVMGAACPKCSGRYRILAETHVAAPIAQTAPQGKFRMGDIVKKSTGSEWEGRVVGWYSTEQTKEGYAVESEAHAGSVQIYPAMAAKEAGTEHVCSGCGAKGWTGNCLECIPY